MLDSMGWLYQSEINKPVVIHPPHEYLLKDAALDGWTQEESTPEPVSETKYNPADDRFIDLKILLWGALHSNRFAYSSKDMGVQFRLPEIQFVNEDWYPRLAIYFYPEFEIRIPWQMRLDYCDAHGITIDPDDDCVEF